jgi:hypothetical protein
MCTRFLDVQVICFILHILFILHSLNETQNTDQFFRAKLESAGWKECWLSCRSYSNRFSPTTFVLGLFSKKSSQQRHDHKSRDKSIMSLSKNRQVTVLTDVVLPQW